jgi:hypothetical protein
MKMKRFRNSRSLLSNRGILEQFFLYFETNPIGQKNRLRGATNQLDKKCDKTSG